MEPLVVVAWGAGESDEEAGMRARADTLPPEREYLTLATKRARTRDRLLVITALLVLGSARLIVRGELDSPGQTRALGSRTLVATAAASEPAGARALSPLATDVSFDVATETLATPELALAQSEPPAPADWEPVDAELLGRVRQALDAPLEVRPGAPVEVRKAVRPASPRRSRAPRESKSRRAGIIRETPF